MTIIQQIKNTIAKVAVWAEMLKFSNKQLSGTKRTNLYNAALRSYLSTDKALYNAVKALHVFPVTIEEFLTNKQYLGAVMDYWPETIKKLKDVLPDVWNGESYLNTTYTGVSVGEGTTLPKPLYEVTFRNKRGKTTLLTSTFLYIWYIHTCFKPYDIDRLDFLVGSGRGIRDAENTLDNVRRGIDLMPCFNKLSLSGVATGVMGTKSRSIRLEQEHVYGTKPTVCFIENASTSKYPKDFINEVITRFKIRDLTPPEILFPFTQAIYITKEYPET
jgi:hypothetical protein